MQLKFHPQSSADQRFFRRFAIIYTQHALLVFSDPRRNTERCLRNRNTHLSYYYRKERIAETEIGYRFIISRNPPLINTKRRIHLIKTSAPPESHDCGLRLQRNEHV